MNNVNLNNEEKDNNLENDNQVNNIYDSFLKKVQSDNDDKNDKDKTNRKHDKNENNKDDKEDNTKTEKSDDKHHYQEKKYNDNYLDEHTVVTTASKLSRLVLVGFYLIILIVGVLVFFMLRADRYEIYLTSDKVTINEGSSYQIELTPKNVRYFDYLNYDYKTDDQTIATVDEYGTITGVHAGQTILTISKGIGFIKKKMIVNIDNTPINSIDLVSSKNKNANSNGINMVSNESIKLTAVSKKNNNVNAKYSSSDENIAVVDDFGNVTAKEKGTVTITGTASEVTSETTINVTDPNNENFVESITLDGIVSVKIGHAVVLTPTIKPANVSSSLTWNSSDTSIVSVSSSGVVIGKKVGTAVVTVTTSNGKTASSSINVVSDSIEVSSISLNSSKIQIDKGGTNQLIATISPSNATIRDIKWSSSNTSVATVSDNGLVKGINKGTATITATTTNGKKATCDVTISDNSTQIITATKIDIGIDQTSKYVGETLSLVPTITPSSISTSKVEWTSSNNSVATVTNGVVKTLKKGTAVITASIDGKTDTCTIIVKEKESQTVPAGTQISANEVKLSTTSLTVNKGGTATFSIKVSGAAGVITVSSSNPSVVTVSTSNSDCNDTKCFFDAQTGKESSIEYTVTGVSSNTAYINVSLDDIVSYDEKTITGSGKIGVLVK